MSDALFPRIVERAENAPGKCLVTSDIDGPFIDTGTWASQIDPYIYLHVPYIEQLGRDLLGMVPRAEVEVIEERVRKMGDEIDALKAYVAAMEDMREVEELVS